MSDYYDPRGNPISMDEWAELRKGDDSLWKEVRQQTKVGEAEVSTVWLGMDHSWGHGPPLIFESMVFGGNLDQEQLRYSTLDEARAGHQALCDKVLREAAAFAALAADEMVRDCVAAIEKVLNEHRAAFDLGQYGDLYSPLVKAVTA